MLRRWMQKRFEQEDSPLRDYLARRNETLHFVIPAGELTALDAFCRLGVGDTMVVAFYPDQGVVGSLAFEEVGQIGYTGADGGY